jgi:hypothetical protein
MSVIDDLLTEVEAEPDSDAVMALGLVLEGSQADTSNAASDTLREAFPEIGAHRPTDDEIARITERLVKLVNEGKASPAVVWALGRSPRPAAKDAVANLLRRLLEEPTGLRDEDLLYEALSTLMRFPSDPRLRELTELVSQRSSGSVKELADKLIESRWVVPPTDGMLGSRIRGVSAEPTLTIDTSNFVGEVSRPDRTLIVTFMLGEFPHEASTFKSTRLRHLTLRVYNLPLGTTRAIRGETGWRHWLSRAEARRVEVRVFFPRQSSHEESTLYSVFTYRVGSVEESGSYGGDTITELRLIPSSDVEP